MDTSTGFEAGAASGGFFDSDCVPGSTISLVTDPLCFFSQCSIQKSLLLNVTRALGHFGSGQGNLPFASRSIVAGGDDSTEEGVPTLLSGVRVTVESQGVSGAALATLSLGNDGGNLVAIEEAEARDTRPAGCELSGGSQKSS